MLECWQVGHKSQSNKNSEPQKVAAAERPSGTWPRSGPDPHLREQRGTAALSARSASWLSFRESLDEAMAALRDTSEGFATLMRQENRSMEALEM